MIYLDHAATTPVPEEVARPGCSWLVYPLLERWPLAPLYPGKGEPENTNDCGFFSR